jgi:hypothetical protein
MAEEIMTNEQGTDIQEPNYVEEIQQWKANSVPLEKYNKLQAEHKQAMDALMNGGQLEQEIMAQSTMDYKAELSKLIHGEESKSNLDFVRRLLEIREAGLKQGENINMPFGPKAEYTENDEAETEFVAKCLQECVDKAEGNPSAFNFYFDQMMVDNAPPAITNKRRFTR